MARLPRLVLPGYPYHVTRMTAWAEAGSPPPPAASPTPAATMSWSYDAVGNIRRTVASRASLDWQGSAGTTRVAEERWFSHDARGRVVRGDGRGYGTVTANAETSRRAGYGVFGYDAMGRQTSWIDRDGPRGVLQTDS